MTTYGVTDLDCADLRPPDIVDFATELGAGCRKPQAVTNDLSHLCALLGLARSARGIDFPRDPMRDALEARKRLWLVATSTQRERRPTCDELTRLYRFFQERRALPMDTFLVFAVFFARRQEEFTRILVRDMKNPGQQKGNRV